MMVNDRRRDVLQFVEAPKQPQDEKHPHQQHADHSQQQLPNPEGYRQVEDQYRDKENRSQ